MLFLDLPTILDFGLAGVAILWLIAPRILHRRRQVADTQPDPGEAAPDPKLPGTANSPIIGRISHR